jgi:DNA-binding transcriptional ArsR family regulator
MPVERTILADQQADLCKTFSNPTRILILWTLSERELSVSEIANAVNATVQNTSHHLRVMKDKGILNSRRQGQTIFYGIHDRESVANLLCKSPTYDEENRHSS